MSAYGGPNIVEDGLVLALDAANIKSFRGEPTTNIANQTIGIVAYITPTYVGEENGWKKYSLSGTWNGGTYPYSIAIAATTFTGGLGYSTSIDIKCNCLSKFNAFGGINYVNDPNMTSAGISSVITLGIDPLDGLTIQRWRRENFIYSTGYANPTTVQAGYLISRPTSNGTVFNSSTDFIWIKNLQIEQKAYSTWYVNGTRGTTVATGGGWADRSGNSNHGELVNGPTYNSSNLGSLVFDGTNDYTDIDQIPGDFSNFTVGIWFYPTSVTNYENPIDCNYSYNGSTGNIGPRLEMTSLGTLTWVWSGDSSVNSNYYYTNIKQSGLTANTWHYACISRTSSNTVIGFLDGEVTSTSTIVQGTPSSTFVNVFTNVILGKGFHLGGAERIYTGRLPYVHIYNRALSASEVLQNYNATRERFGL